MAKQGKIRSFRKGWQQVRPVDMPQLKESIMAILGIANRNSWGMCIGRGFRMYDLQAVAIEREFLKYGVQQHAIWDDPTENWEVVILEATGNIQLYNKLTGFKQTFDTISGLLNYARREHIELPTVEQVRTE